MVLAACMGAREAQAPPPPVASQAAAHATLYLAGDGELAVVDVEAETARVIPLEELAAGDPPYRIVRRGHDLVFYGGPTYAVDLELRSEPRRLGSSWFFIPSATEDRMWLAYLDPESPETVRALSAVAEITSHGVVTVPPTRPPGGRWPVAAVSAGLLFERRSGGLELWDPARGRILERLPEASFGPTHGNLLAWCDAENRLHLTDVLRGADRARLAPPPGFAVFRCWDAAFAPDGRTLAIPVSRRVDLRGRHALALVDVGSGAARVVDGSTVPAGYVFVAWDSSGEQVFLTGGERGQQRAIVAYRIGEERARQLAVDVPDFYGIAAS
jgi:hypothetical protein